MSAWRRSTSSTRRLTERLWWSLSAMAAMAAMAAVMDATMAAVMDATMAATVVMAVEAVITAAVATAVMAVMGAGAAAGGEAAVAVVAAVDIGAGGMALGTGAIGVTSPSFLLRAAHPLLFVGCSQQFGQLRYVARYPSRLILSKHPAMLAASFVSRQ